MGHAGECPTTCSDRPASWPSGVAPTLLERLWEDADLTSDDLRQLREGLNQYTCMHSSGSATGNAKRLRGTSEDSCLESGGNGSSFKRASRSMPGGCVRAVADYEDKSSRFVIQTRKYQQQYSAVYFARLAALKDTLLAEARRRWPDIPVRACIRDVQTWVIDSLRARVLVDDFVWSLRSPEAVRRWLLGLTWEALFRSGGHGTRLVCQGLDSEACMYEGLPLVRSLSDGSRSLGLLYPSGVVFAVIAGLAYQQSVRATYARTKEACLEDIALCSLSEVQAS